ERAQLICERGEPNLALVFPGESQHVARISTAEVGRGAGSDDQRVQHSGSLRRTAGALRMKGPRLRKDARPSLQCLFHRGEEVAKQLVDAFSLVVMDPVRCARQALDAVRLGTSSWSGSAR